ncbi:MAG: HAMP domain-containing sensor histidine kinase [Marinoscillum sp.]
MKKQIVFILVLMTVSTCVLICFQFYWSYQSYQTSMDHFEVEVNDAFREAINEEKELRRLAIVQQYQGWLADTSQIEISCRLVMDSLTQFTITEKGPDSLSRINSFSMSFPSFKGKLDSITTEAKEYFIHQFGQENILRDLRAGAIVFYTQGLGHKLRKATLESSVNLNALDSLYHRQLEDRNVNANFTLIHDSTSNSISTNTPSLITEAFNTGITTRDDLHVTVMPTEDINNVVQKNSQLVSASFANPIGVMLRRMKGILLSSIVLTGIVIFCFFYTVKTMLQHTKLTELKNDFVNNMTHELRTPVATIMVAIEAIQNFKLTPQTTKDYHGIIHEQGNRISLMIDKILKSLAVEQSKLELSMNRFDIRTVVEEVAHQFKPQLEHFNADLRLTMEKAGLVVVADRSHISNVISTLLDNAFKYSQKTIAISINLYSKNGYAHLEVTDSGIGIPQEYQQKVFEKFFRVPSGDQHNVKGYGLGLSYARTVIEKHSGSIRLSSKENIGTCVTITLPLVKHETT